MLAPIALYCMHQNLLLEARPIRSKSSVYPNSRKTLNCRVKHRRRTARWAPNETALVSSEWLPCERDETGPPWPGGASVPDKRGATPCSEGTERVTPAWPQVQMGRAARLWRCASHLIASAGTSACAAFREARSCTASSSTSAALPGTRRLATTRFLLGIWLPRLFPEASIGDCRHGPRHRCW